MLPEGEDDQRQHTSMRSMVQVHWFVRETDPKKWVLMLCFIFGGKEEE